MDQHFSLPTHYRIACPACDGAAIGCSACEETGEGPLVPFTDLPPAAGVATPDPQHSSHELPAWIDREWVTLGTPAALVAMDEWGQLDQPYDPDYRIDWSAPTGPAYIASLVVNIKLGGYFEQRWLCSLTVDMEDQFYLQPASDSVRLTYLHAPTVTYDSTGHDERASCGPFCDCPF